MIAAGEAPDVSYSASWKCQMGEDGLIYNFYDLLDDMGPVSYTHLPLRLFYSVWAGWLIPPGWLPDH